MDIVVDKQIEAIYFTHFKHTSRSLEDLWVNHMNVLFKHLPDEWVLAPMQPDHKISSNWNTFRDLAKVRFYCQVS